MRFDTGGYSLRLHAGAEGDPVDDAPTFVFSVDDVEAARAHLQDHDVRIGDVRAPVPWTAVCGGLDPEGNEFSIESSG